MKNIEIFISQTLSINTKIEVPDNYTIDDVRDAIYNQILLPSDVCHGWDEDDFEFSINKL